MTFISFYFCRSIWLAGSLACTGTGTNTLRSWTFTPKSDHVQISPVASPVILHHTVWRTWLFIAYSDWKMILVPVLTTSLIHFSWKGWENALFELGIERVNKWQQENFEQGPLCYYSHKVFKAHTIFLFFFSGQLTETSELAAEIRASCKCGSQWVHV